VLFSGITVGGITLINAKSAEAVRSDQTLQAPIVVASPIASPAALPQTKRVKLHFEPKSAAVTMDDHKTVIPTEGQGIATLEVQEGASFTVYVSAAGHKEASVLVQSLNADVVVPPLEKIKAAAMPVGSKNTSASATSEKLMPVALPKCPDDRWASKEGRCCKSKALFGKCQEL
jgi:hypothetical protein